MRVVLDGPVQEAGRILRDHVQSLEAQLVPALRTAAAILAELSGAADLWQVQLGGPDPNRWAFASFLARTSATGVGETHISDNGGNC